MLEVPAPSAAAAADASPFHDAQTISLSRDTLAVAASSAAARHRRPDLDREPGEPAPPTPTAASTAAPTARPTAAGPPPISAREEIREVMGDVASEWRKMSGKDRAGTAAVAVYNGFAGLWNVGLVLVGILAVGLWLFSGCSSGLSASSTCDQYMKADQQTRYSAAESLGRKASGSTFKGPMAGLNLDYSCSYASGSRTIGSIMGVSS